MDDSKSPFTWLFLVLGIALIGFAFFWDRRPSPQPSSQLTLSQAHKLTGKASIFRNGMIARENLKEGSSLGHLDSIETGDLGEVRLSFESGAKVRVKEHSLLTLERVEDQESFHIVLILKRGGLEVETPGTPGTLFIGKNGDRIAAADYQSSALSLAPVIDSQPLEAPSSPLTEDSGLTEKDIQDTMANHQTSFLKCYSQLLQKDSSAKGQASLTFTVENSGKVSSADITSGQLQDADFKKCLIDIMKRIEFRSFKGPQISTLFPLNFE